MKEINIVLVCPEIPQNTGNISRTCAVTGAKLHIVKPIGFEISDRTLKRAGLDYWDKLDVTYYENYNDFIRQNEDAKLYFFSAHGKHAHTDIDYPDGAIVRNITLFAVLIYEIVGPYLTKIALTKAGRHEPLKSPHPWL